MTNNPNCKQCPSAINSVFSTITPEENTFIELEKTCSNYKRGDVIYREGSRINGVFCIYSGILKIYKTGSDGKEQIVAFAKEGNIMGYRSVLSHEPACTTAQAIEDALICYIPASVIFDLIKTNGNFALSLMQLICNELNQANSYIKDIAQKTVRERLAEVLLMLETNFGTNDGGFLNITLTREELANIVGTATESVIRLLSEFKSEEIIIVSRKFIKLNNRAFLKKLSKSFN